MDQCGIAGSDGLKRVIGCRVGSALPTLSPQRSWVRAQAMSLLNALRTLAPNLPLHFIESGKAGFGCIGVALTVTTVGLLRNQDAPTAAITRATAAIPFISISQKIGLSESARDNHAVLAP